MEKERRLGKQIDDRVKRTPPVLPRFDPAASPQFAQGHQWYHFSRWNYSALRAIIKTSCHTKELKTHVRRIRKACYQEYKRRRLAYQAWKDALKARHTVYTAEARTSYAQGSATQTQNMYAPSAPSLYLFDDEWPRYFRVPLVHEASTESPCGWLYAYFDGPYVARQIEIHPGKKPLLLLAGVPHHDPHETGLTRQHGAEIHASEFEHLWSQYCSNLI